MIQFFISGHPLPQSRPRTFWHKGIGRYCTMNPREAEGWKDTIRAKAYPYRPKEPADYPVRVKLEFHMPRPASAKDELWACVKPDLDNLIKSVLDALQSARFFKDDSREVWLEAKKIYSPEGRVGVKVTVLGVKEK